MKKLLMLVVGGLALLSLTAQAQMIKRTDAVWARNITGSITLDGKLTEPEWATADSVRVQMGKSSGMPGSGWKWENGLGFGKNLDPTDATIKFLAKGDSLYIAYICKDKSIGSGDFNYFDGFLMNIRYAQSTGMAGTVYHPERPSQSCEVFYAWVIWDTLTKPIGAPPSFFGDWGSPINRPDSLRRNFWDAACTVHGKTNTDTTADTSYVYEVKVNLKAFGYNVTQTGGDVVAWSTSIYDGDYEWPLDTNKQSGNRAWVQCPWSNGSNFGHLNIYIDPAVTNGTLPTIAADFRVPDAKNNAAPVIDGKLDEAAWKNAPSFRMKYGDAALRATYPGTMKIRSGQTQPEVNGAKNAVSDPNNVIVKYFFRGDSLYLGFDVSDKYIQSTPGLSDRYDGIRVTINDRKVLNVDDSVMQVRSLMFRVDSAGTTKRLEDLLTWDTLGTNVLAKIHLNSGSTVDTLGTQADSGYTAEMRIDLTKFGYAHGLGDGVVFLGITEYDGDSPANHLAYGTTTYLGRGTAGDDGPAWFYLDPTYVETDVKEAVNGVAEGFALLGNYPNPFNPSTTIRFTIDRSSEVTMDVYDILGRLVSSRSLGVKTAGQQQVRFDASTLASGTYYYRLKMMATSQTVSGKMLLLK